MCFTRKSLCNLGKTYMANQLGVVESKDGPAHEIASRGEVYSGTLDRGRAAIGAAPVLVAGGLVYAGRVICNPVSLCSIVLDIAEDLLAGVGATERVASWITGAQLGQPVAGAGLEATGAVDAMLDWSVEGLAVGNGVLLEDGLVRGIGSVGLGQDGGGLEDLVLFGVKAGRVDAAGGLARRIQASKGVVVVLGLAFRLPSSRCSQSFEPHLSPGRWRPCEGEDGFQRQVGPGRSVDTKPRAL